MNIKSLLIGSSAILACGLMSSTALALPPPGGDGGCSVSRVTGSGVVYYVPSGGSGTYNMIGWGNGTGGGSSTYRGMLESVAKECVFIAAATTANSGSGTDVQNAVNSAKSRYRNILGSNPKVCTSGHSQGGGGAFNAANRIGAACVIAVQPDTVFTTSITRPVSSSTDVVCIFTSGDTLAPALPSNAANCRRNSTRYTQENGSGSHFVPTSGTGGDPGRFMREYAKRWLVN